MEKVTLNLTAQELDMVVRALQTVTVQVKDAPVVLGLIDNIVKQVNEQQDAKDNSCKL